MLQHSTTITKNIEHSKNTKRLYPNSVEITYIWRAICPRMKYIVITTVSNSNTLCNGYKTTIQTQCGYQCNDISYNIWRNKNKKKVWELELICIIFFFVNFSKKFKILTPLLEVGTVAESLKFLCCFLFIFDLDSWMLVLYSSLCSHIIFILLHILASPLCERKA